MRPIVCATRGGEASRRTQERAVALAKERGTGLVFLCVTDPTFVHPTDKDLAVALSDELRRLSQALLSIARVRAQKQGVDARTAVFCCGPVKEQITSYLREVNAATLVIGKPRRGPIPQAFSTGEIEHFAQEVRASTGVEVIVVT